MQIEKENDIILYKYDNQGNTLEQKSNNGTITYQYDIYNRTRQVVTENGDIIKNKYDPLGFRYQKEVNGDTNRYIFDDWNVIAETNKEGEIKSREVRGYELLKKETDNKYYFYHQNEHGDIIYLSDTAGEIENSYSYDVFGNIREEKEVVSNYFKYSGEQYEKEIEQYYLRARFYNPVVGRFTQEDIYRNDGLNLYVYVVNNPLLWVDPSGLAKCSKVLLRGDKDIYATTNNKDIRKSYITDEGNLTPANLQGTYVTKRNPNEIKTVGVVQHILGGFRKNAKNNSPFTSFSFKEDVANKYSYNNDIIEVDISGLRKAIQSGEVTDVAILSPKRIKELISNSNTETDFWKNRALKWSKRDEEYLIKGEIPKEFIKIRREEEK